MNCLLTEFGETPRSPQRSRVLRTYLLLLLLVGSRFFLTCFCLYFSVEFFMASYYPESMKHTNDVASIVNWFREKGYDMIMDKMASNEISSKGPMRWAECQIKRANKVIIFMSPGYVRLCEDDEEVAQGSSDDVKRVWYEMRLLKNMYCNTHSSAKMVCVLIDEKIATQDLPPWAQVRYRWPKDREEIIKRLNDNVEITPAKVAVRFKN